MEFSSRVSYKELVTVWSDTWERGRSRGEGRERERERGGGDCYVCVMI